MKGRFPPPNLLLKSRPAVFNPTKNSAPASSLRTYLSANSTAHNLAKLLSVAPSATATRMPTGGRVGRCAQASSYSSRLLPSFGQQKTLMSHSLAAWRASPPEVPIAVVLSADAHSPVACRYRENGLRATVAR